MAMNDPRMQNLVEKEGLKGLGAYWVIIEKLAMLPEPRAQFSYIRPFCDRKIPLSYLKRIVLEYNLFEMEDEGYFMPKELNPPRKKGEKTAQNGSEKSGSEAKNNEKTAEKARKNARKTTQNPDKTQETSDLQKGNSDNNNNITTTSSTEEKEEGEGGEEGAGKGGEEAGKIRPIEPWHKLIDQLSEESAWLDIACIHSGYGKLLKQHIKEAVETFRQHIILHDNGNTLLELKDARQYFVNFVRAGQRTSQTLYMHLSELDARLSAAAQPDPYRYELLVDGRRTYQGCPIPDNAPPRPDKNAAWNEELQCWMTGKKPPKASC